MDTACGVGSGGGDRGGDGGGCGGGAPGKANLWLRFELRDNSTYLGGKQI